VPLLFGDILQQIETDWLVQQLNERRLQNGEKLHVAKRKVEKDIATIDVKLDRLTAGYLDAGAFTAAEFRKRKEEVINRKRKLQDDVAALDRQDVLRFEPITRFVNGSKQMKYVAANGDPKELRTKFENVGSNLTIQDRTVHWFPRGAWKLVVDQGSFAQHNTAPEISGAVFLGESRLYPTKCTRQESNLRLIGMFHLQPSVPKLFREARNALSCRKNRAFQL